MKRGFTLTEMLIVIALSATMLCFVGQFFAEGWVALHRALGRVDSNESVTIISKAWQGSLRGTTPSSWSVEDNVFKAGSTTVKQDGKDLLFVVDGREKHILLPHGAAIRFSVESPPDAAKCAVMDMGWESRYFRNLRTNHVCFVACGRKGENRE